MEEYRYRLIKIVFYFALIFALFSCASPSKMPYKQHNSQSESLIKGVKLLKVGRYQGARKIFASVLRHDPTNCRANFLNAFSYDLEGKTKDDYNLISTAQIGYKLAQKFCRYEDPWPFFYSGVNNYHMSHFEEATLDFGIAAGISKSQLSRKYILEWYATALFSSGHPDLANQIIEKYLTNEESTNLTANEKKLFKNLYRKMKAKKVSKKFATAHADQNAVAKQIKRNKQSTNIKTNKTNGTNGTNGINGKNNNASDKTYKHNQVIIDAVIILTRRINSTSAGVNILDGLKLQFGTSTNDAWRQVNERYVNKFRPYNSQTSGSGSYPTVPFEKVITQAISVPTISYDLNIFNSSFEDSEILARPTLVASEGESAEYFSGRKLILGISGSSSESGEIQTMPIGLTLKVTPEFLAGNAVKLNVEIGRDFITQSQTTTSSINFQNVVDTVSESVSTTIALNYGETAILSALSETAIEKTKKGVTFLNKIPLLKYFFNKDTNQGTQTYVLILLTPQPYLSFRYPKGYDEKNKLAYLYSTLVDPASNIEKVFRGVYDMSIYRRDLSELSNVLTLTNGYNIRLQTFEDEIKALKKTLYLDQ